MSWLVYTDGVCWQIPVYSGADRPLVHRYIYPERPFHGHDGFGDADLPPQPPAATMLQPQHAVSALLDLAVRHSGEAGLLLWRLGAIHYTVAIFVVTPLFIFFISSEFGVHLG